MTPDGTAVVCTRVESKHATRNEAWLHPLGDRPLGHRPTRLALLPSRRLDLEELALRLISNVTSDRLEAFASHLGVAPAALVALGIGWTDRAWSFPMTDGEGQVIGIRYRNSHGEKWSERGGHEGVFRRLHADLNDGLLLMPEGPTSSVAALTLGFEVVGRPNDRGGRQICWELARGRDVVVVADRDVDGQGQRGAEGLAQHQVKSAASVRVITPPVKDLRDWLRVGATREDVDELIAAAPVRRLEVRYR